MSSLLLLVPCADIQTGVNYDSCNVDFDVDAHVLHDLQRQAMRLGCAGSRLSTDSSRQGIVSHSRLVALSVSVLIMFVCYMVKPVTLRGRYVPPTAIVRWSRRSLGGM